MWRSLDDLTSVSGLSTAALAGREPLTYSVPELSGAGDGETQGDGASRQPQSEAPVAHPADQAGRRGPALARVRARGRGLRDRPDDLLLQPRASARLRGHQYLHEGTLLRGRPQGRGLRGGVRWRSLRHGDDVPAGRALRAAGGPADLCAL